jgi:hypothetical protein
MAVSRIKTSSILQGFPKSRSLLAGNAGYDPAATFLIQRIAGTGSSGTITFSSIPQTYKHLQVRLIANNNSGNFSLRLRLNGDTGTNYAHHVLEGGGSSAYAYGAASANAIFYVGSAIGGSGSGANFFGASIIDIHDYASTTKNKTVRTLNGHDSNGAVDAQQIRLTSGLWMNTAAVTSISILDLSANFTTTSTFALYGMVG